MPGGKALAALALLAVAAAAQEPRLTRTRIDLLVAEPKPLAEDEVAAAIERALSATRVTEDTFDPKNKDTYLLGQGTHCWQALVGTRAFSIRSVDEPVLNENFALERYPKFADAMAAHRGFIEFTGADSHARGREGQRGQVREARGARPGLNAGRGDLRRLHPSGEARAGREAGRGPLRASARYGAAGSRSENTAPPPSRSETSTRPWWAIA